MGSMDGLALKHSCFDSCENEKVGENCLNGYGDVGIRVSCLLMVSLLVAFNLSVTVQPVLALAVWQTFIEPDETWQK